MRLLSLTFHSENSIVEDWMNYVESSFQPMLENLMDVEKYIFSEVHSEMLNEGKNLNLLLFFDNEDLLDQFLRNEFLNLEERIQQEFGNKIMIFNTLLNPKTFRL